VAYGADEAHRVDRAPPRLLPRRGIADVQPAARDHRAPDDGKPLLIEGGGDGIPFHPVVETAPDAGSTERLANWSGHRRPCLRTGTPLRTDSAPVRPSPTPRTASARRNAAGTTLVPMPCLHGRERQGCGRHRTSVVHRTAWADPALWFVFALTQITDLTAEAPSVGGLVGGATSCAPTRA
jgi:hypothetical protein